MRPRACLDQYRAVTRAEPSCRRRRRLPCGELVGERLTQDRFGESWHEVTTAADDGGRVQDAGDHRLFARLDHRLEELVVGTAMQRSMR